MRNRAVEANGYAARKNAPARRRTLRRSQREAQVAPPTYEIRVVGSVPAELMPTLGDVSVTEQELRTVLTGDFVDQADLYGFLKRLRALGLDLAEVRSVPPADNG